MKPGDDGENQPGNPSDLDPPVTFALKDAERYTMAEAATIKGVSYHTVSRAVRQGRLPVTRLGRMALIGGQDLANWAPMRERAPRRYRQAPATDRVPAPLVLDKAFGDRVGIARQLATVFEVIHAASSELSLPEFAALLADRFSTIFGLTRVSLWTANSRDGKGERLATIGGSLTAIPDRITISAGFSRIFASIDLGHARVSLDPRTEFHDETTPGNLFPPGPLLIVPLRVRDRTVGALFGDRAGEYLALDQDQLALAEVLANQAALAVDHATLRKKERFRINQLSAILDQMGDQVRACDTDGRLNLMNRMDKIFASGEADAASAIGSDALTNPGVSARNELDGTPIPRDRHPLARALRGEIIANWEYDVTRVDGRVQRAQVSARPIVVDGEITGAVYIGRNISARRDQERQDQERLAWLERANRRARSLAGLAIRLTLPQTPSEIIQAALECLDGTLGQSGGLGLAIDEDGRLTVCAALHLPPDFQAPAMDNPISMSTTIMAFSRQAPVAVARYEAGRAEAEIMGSVDAQGLLVIPIQIDRDPLGAFHLFHAGPPAPDEDEMTFATAVGQLCAQAIDRSRLHAGEGKAGSVESPESS